MSQPGADATPPGPVRVRVAMPAQLRDLAKVTGEVAVEVPPPVTLAATLDALEAAHPTLTGTIRDRDTGRRRPMIRIYADGEDYSDAPATATLPTPVVTAREPLRLVGSIAGG
jgi:sulfur-carrier protein